MAILNGIRYSRMDQVKFVKDSLYKNLTWSILEYLDPNVLLPFTDIYINFLPTI